MSYLTYTSHTGLQMNFVADNYVMPMISPATETGQMGSTMLGNPGRIVSYPGGTLVVSGVGKN
jgi:hypothetical protein